MLLMLISEESLRFINYKNALKNFYLKCIKLKKKYYIVDDKRLPIG